jgi:hypothetical protein
MHSPGAAPKEAKEKKKKKKKATVDEAIDGAKTRLAQLVKGATSENAPLVERRQTAPRPGQPADD